MSVLAAGVAMLAFAPAAVPANGHANYHAVCASAPDEGRCHAQVVTDQRGNPLASTSPTGLGPAQFHAAYGLPTTSATPQTIAIVDAFDAPTAKSDLDVYNSAYGLPFFPSCGGAVTTSCFQKVTQDGGTNFKPYRTNAGWALETALDVQTAHAICQNCKILLVEARTNSFANLMAAVDTAAAMGANVISNSYGASEFSSETSYDFHFNRPGVAITVSTGDSGFGVQYPAASQYVTAVGGTTLNVNPDGTRASETAWSGAGSGCSAYEPKPAWQTDAGCSRRFLADVSADADPATGASVYDSTPYQGQSGWFTVGGTSLAAPLVGGVYALGTSNVTYGSYPYSHSSSLFDVTLGSNGSCSPAYFCTAGPGLDGPTGLGAPNGVDGF